MDPLEVSSPWDATVLQLAGSTRTTSQSPSNREGNGDSRERDRAEVGEMSFRKLGGGTPWKRWRSGGGERGGTPSDTRAASTPGRGERGIRRRLGFGSGGGLSAKCHLLGVI
jgi:hypothetical protein